MGEPDISFRDLHVSGDPFILANAWDMGSAKMLATLGAKALATTSAGFAFTQGLPDLGNLSRKASIEHGREMSLATPLPVSADLEDGFGTQPEDVGATIEMAIDAGLAGCCIEDVDLPSSGAVDFSLAVARIEAGAAAAKSRLGEKGGDFVLTARADGLMHGTYDLVEAIRRLKAFEAVGADVLYAPMPDSMDDLAEICRALKKPVNALCAGQFTAFRRAEFGNIGVARISLGSSLARVTHKAIFDCSQSIFERDDLSVLGAGIGADIIDPMLTK